jgi:hypothetical protein
VLYASGAAAGDLRKGCDDSVRKVLQKALKKERRPIG